MDGSSDSDTDSDFHGPLTSTPRAKRGCGTHPGLSESAIGLELEKTVSSYLSSDFEYESPEEDSEGEYTSGAEDSEDHTAASEEPPHPSTSSVRTAFAADAGIPSTSRGIGPAPPCALEGTALSTPTSSTHGHPSSLLFSSFMEKSTAGRYRKRLELSFSSSSENEEAVDDPQPSQPINQVKKEQGEHVYLSTYVFICAYTCLSIYLSIYQSIYLSIYPPLEIDR